MSNYLEYYLRTATHKSGLKLVVGGTGLGKTSSIPEFILNYPDKTKKFIYIANRHQLLDEMAKDLSKKKIPHYLLPRDLEAVSNAILNQREAISEFLEDGRTQHILRNANINILEVERVCDDLSELGDYRQLNARLQRQVDNDARNIVMYTFRTVLNETSEKHKRELVSKPIIHTLFPFVAFRTSN